MNLARVTVFDESTGQPVQGVQVYAADVNGNAAAIARGDEFGQVSIAAPDTALSVLVTAPGYMPKTFDTGSLSDGETINITPAALSQGQATHVIQNKTLSALPWWVWVGAAGVFIYVIGGDNPKKKKISGTSDFSGYVIPLGVIVLAYLVLKNFDLFGPSAASTNATGIDTSTSAGVDNSLAAAQAAGDFATLSQSEAAGIADAIFQAGLQHDAYTVKRQLINVNTLTDLLNVIKAFGTKKADVSSFSPCATLGIFCQSYNLNAWLHLPFMDSSSLADINNYLSAQGINYQF